MTDATHQEHENDSWTINIGDHAGRENSPQYDRSRRLMIAAVKQASEARPWIFGDPPYQDHHGGGVWVLLNGAPTLFLSACGIEWSAQFAADPAKVDRIRVDVAALVSACTGTRKWYTDTLGMTKDDLSVLDTPIKDADGVARWTDSFWNASVPLPQSMHTGYPPKADPGYHHAPKPIVDVRVFARDDFVLFPRPGVAVLPVAPRGSGDGRVRVAWVSPDHPDHLAAMRLSATAMASEAVAEGQVLPADHPIARAAFANQEEAHDSAHADPEPGSDPGAVA